jgi:8-hydroxy-5-deazaflavin:NADPH oxidoreductase
MLGTGTVGQTVGGKLAGLGHDVCMGSRTPDNEGAAAWVERTGEHASQGTFADAAAFGNEIVVNATPGAVSLDVLHAAGADNLAGKILLDISNPLDFSRGMPPTLTVCNTDSLGEQIQRAFPDARVVKSLNTMNARVMVDPGSVRGPHTVFVAGDDHVARWQVKQLLLQFGWRGDAIFEFDGIAKARGLEMYLPLWLALRGAIGDRPFNIKVAS